MMTPDEYKKAHYRAKVRERVRRYRERKRASEEAQKICNIFATSEVTKDDQK